jgi:dihydrofolate synthase/folylpolyglutamate synthase
MTYKQTLDYLLSKLPMFHRIGAAAYKANLDNSHALDELLGHPHQLFKTIHVAGTNGKGSTSNMLAAVLQSAGYKTGLFTSPHLKDFRERIRVNGEMISKKYVSAFVEKYKEDFEKIEPSFFEWTVALAFDYFSYKKVDIAVIETGLGGRLDSTNIINPELSVITNIGWDHMNLLGDTLKKIAGEKAGIIKPAIPVVIGETQKEVAEVFLEKAKSENTLVVFADKEFSLKIKNQAISYFDVVICSKQKIVFDNFRIGLGGEYQLKNVLTVLSSLKILIQQGLVIPSKAISAGIKNVCTLTGFKGRWEKIGDKPLIIADTGHNFDGVKQVVRQIKKLNFDKLHFVIGVVTDKDVSKLLLMLPKKAEYYFCQASIPRAMDHKELKSRALLSGIKGESFPTVKKALMAARNNATKNDLIFVGGSTFVVAEIM